MAGPTKLKPLPRSFYQKTTLELARELLGVCLVHESAQGTTVGRIVETEAYLHDDPACHAYRGPTPRTQIMYGAPGFSYMYFIYGMYWCFNVSSAPKGVGEAVLVRALEPLLGVELMRERRSRGVVKIVDRELCRGPGKLVIAMGMPPNLNGVKLSGLPLFLAAADAPGPGRIRSAARIGLKKAQEPLYRFYLEDSAFVSKK